MLLISCKSEPKLNGSYSNCYNGLYSEFSIEKDSFRMTTSMEFVSDRRKYEIKNDSFYYTSFGTPEFRVAKINFMGNNSFELIDSKDSISHIFNKMNIIIDYNISYEQFFDEFYKRGIENKCLPESE